jgi:putative iron-dependent peroxidase
MTHPQPGIFALGTSAHWHLEATLRDGATPAALVDVVRSLGREGATTSGVDLVVGFGAEAWAGAGGEIPEGMTAFRSVTGPDGFTVPATQCDVWAWIAGSGDDVVFDRARAVAAGLGRVCDVVYEQHGFAYRDCRDLTGFVDGTENPPVDEAVAVATVPDGRPGAGGSVVVVQRWVHDLGAFERLTVADQEAVIGRTKPDSVELDEERRPDDAHISRVVIEEEGEELEIFRRSTPFGSLSEHGLQFVGFSADQRRLDLMLARMAGLDGGPRDRLTRFSTPVRSAYYFTPPLEAVAAA